MYKEMWGVLPDDCGYVCGCKEGYKLVDGKCVPDCNKKRKFT